MQPDEMALWALYRLHRDNPDGLKRLAMAPYFPDCYDEWSLMCGTNVLFEGTEDACRQFARKSFDSDELAQLHLMDWEGREWAV